MIYGYAGIDRRPERDRPSRGAAEARGGQSVREVASGAKTRRTQLRHVIDQLDAGDVLMVTGLDQLARSTRDLLNTLAAIADRKAGFDRSAMHGLTPPRRTAG